MASYELLDSLAICRVYAEALIGAARKAGALDAVRSDVESLGELLRLSPRTRVFFEAVTVGSEEKMVVLEKLLAPQLNELTWRTLKAMARRDRLELVSGLLVSFGRVLSEQSGEVAVDVITAEPLDDAVRQRLADDIGAKLQRPVVLTVSCNPLLIGGLQIKVGDTLVDGSVRTQLDTMRLGLERQVSLNVRAASARMVV
ncbi:MAG: ATP synthase F1 subunit delta [Phycisphaerales bacterium]|nr:ATP synthase F1 subunit delta [Phycisphaerales bacterium]